MCFEMLVFSEWMYQLEGGGWGRSGDQLCLSHQHQPALAVDFILSMSICPFSLGRKVLEHRNFASFIFVYHHCPEKLQKHLITAVGLWVSG